MGMIKCKLNVRLNAIPLMAVSLLAVFGMACTKTELSPRDRYRIETSADSVKFDENGGERTITFSTNAQWQINTASAWLSFPSGTTGEVADNQTVTVSAPAWDQANSSRTALFSIKSGNLATGATVWHFITVIQTGPVVVHRDPGIWSPQDLIDFGNAVAVTPQDYTKWADANGVVNLMADLNFGTTPIPCIGTQSISATVVAPAELAFGGTFDGNGHTIKGTLDGSGKAIVALFTRLAPTGIIQNLTVDVTATNDYAGTDVQRHLAAIVGFSINGTTTAIKNCVAKGTLTLTGAMTNPRVGGIVAYGRCIIDNCSNEATINAIANRVAGICGAGSAATVLTNCTNNGNITVDCLAAQAGGIIGQSQAAISGCTNNGKITATSNGATQIGGIAGQAQNANTMGTCTNNGEIVLNSSATAPTNACGAGGIAGTVNNAGFIFSNCTNNGKVTSNVNDANVAVGGIIATTTLANALTGCQNTATAVITSGANAGGMIGRTSVVNVLTNCGNAGTISPLAGATIPAIWFGGLVGQRGATAPTLTGCTFAGTVKGVPGTSANAIGTNP